MPTSSRVLIEGSLLESLAGQELHEEVAARRLDGRPIDAKEPHEAPVAPTLNCKHRGTGVRERDDPVLVSRPRAQVVDTRAEWIIEPIHARLLVCRDRAEACRGRFFR